VTVLGLRYETSADQLRHVRAELHNLLETDPRVVEDSRVRFVSFGAYSLDLEVVCYIDTRDWAEFLAIREDLMLRMIDVVEACGTGFAFPSQTLYLGKDEGLDAERTRAAEEAARA
jgi:MscS family membrane protein